MGLIKPWIQTYTGKKFSLVDPQPEDICIEDIAIGLWNICRFNGQVKSRYSVAQHSVMCSLFVSDKTFSLEALMHDSPEAYIGDMSSPLKHMPEMKGYRKIEDRIMRVIADKYDLEYPFPPCIKQVDTAMLLAEQYTLRGKPVDEWGINGVPYDGNIIPWKASTAGLTIFKHRFEELNY